MTIHTQSHIFDKSEFYELQTIVSVCPLCGYENQITCDGEQKPDSVLFADYEYQICIYQPCSNPIECDVTVKYIVNV